MPDSNNQDKDPIEDLESGLYSRSFSGRSSKGGSKLSKEKYQVSESWGTGAGGNMKNTDVDSDKPRSSFFPKRKVFSHKTLFLSSLIFFILAVGIGGYLFFSGFIALSPGNVQIEITGPSSVDGGEELVLDVSILNNNNLALENVSFLAEYPQGTRSVDDLSQTLPFVRETLGTVDANSQVNKRLRAVMFGEVDSIRPVRIEIEYSFSGSDSRLSKEEVFEVMIRSAPVVVSVEFPEEVNPVQDVELVAKVKSNSNEVLNNLVVSADYPFRFTFSESDPQPVADNNIWYIGDLQPNEEKEIVIKGSVTGQVNETKTFRFNAGMAEQGDPESVAVNFISSVFSMRVVEPFMDLRMTLGGSGNPEYVTEAGRRVRGNISWNNNIGETVNDVQIEVFLEGDIFERTTVSPGNNGFFRSIDNKIIWDRNVLPGLSSVSPNEGGNVSFDFDIIPNSKMTSDQIWENLDMFVKAEITGTRVSGSQPSRTLSSFTSQRVKITTDMRLNSRIVYSVGPFDNQGPIPPKAEEETTYTIIWSTTSTTNDIENTQIRATLPVYVEWLGNVYPDSENLSYNPTDRSITWDVGKVEAGMGTRLTPKEVAFQVSFLPSLQHLGSTPIIVNQPIMTGIDGFTGVSLEDRVSNLTTRLSTDPVYSGGNYGRVVQ